MANIPLALSVLGAHRKLKAQERWSRQRLEAHQANALALLRQHAYANSPFYRRFHHGLEQAPLTALPVLTKAALMENFDDLSTDRAVRLDGVRAFLGQHREEERYLGRYWVTSTSGTSGHPGFFLLDREEWALEMATALRAFAWAGFNLSPIHRSRVAQITSTNPSHLSSQGGRSMANWWMPTLILDANQPLNDIVERLNAWRPKMLWAYASVLRSLAEEQLAGRLRVAPASVVSASELLTEGIRAQAVAAWGDVVFDTYATTDCGGLAAECDRHRGLHLMEDLAIVEVVDDDNVPVSPGVFGERLLVTVLGSRTQPLIRYQLEDSVRVASSLCTCGRPFHLIEAVQGRIEEMLTLPTITGGRVDLHPVVFSNVMDMLPIAGWQVIEKKDGLHVLLAGAAPKLDDAKVAEDIVLALVSKGVVPPIITTRRVTTIPQAANGKTPLVRSDVSKP